MAGQSCNPICSAASRLPVFFFTFLDPNRSGSKRLFRGEPFETRRWHGWMDSKIIIWALANNSIAAELTEWVLMKPDEVSGALQVINLIRASWLDFPDESHNSLGLKCEAKANTSSDSLTTLWWLWSRSCVYVYVCVCVFVCACGCSHKGEPSPKLVPNSLLSCFVRPPPAQVLTLVAEMNLAL